MKPFSHPVRVLRASVAVALLATTSMAHAEGLDAPEHVPVAADSPVRAIFNANHPRFGYEPWITDGTREGTQLLRSIRRDVSTSPPRQNSSFPDFIADLGDGRVAFTVTFHRNRQGSVTREPYITDGTSAGTQLVRRIGEGATNPRHYTTLGDGRYVFAGRNPRLSWRPCVWVSDGTRQQTAPVVCSNWTVHLPDAFAPLREGQVVFSMNDARRGWEPWVTDGTREGTRMIRNLTRDDSSSHPQEMTQLGEGLVLFTASGAGMGRELWASDGTRAGTRVLTQTPSSTVDNRPKYITPIGGGRALFSLNFELWITDGTPEGTQRIPPETMRDVPSGPMDFTALGDGRALFTAWTGPGGTQLWVTDGTSRGTRIVRQIDSNIRAQAIRALGDGRAIFWVFQPDRGHYALWVSDGTRRGTSRVQQFPNMTWANVLVSHAASMGNGRVLFAYDNGRTGAEPWVTDGTRAGTHLLRNINRADGSMRFTAGIGFTPFIPAQPD